MSLAKLIKNSIEGGVVLISLSALTVLGLSISQPVAAATLLEDNFDAENSGTGTLNYSGLANWDVTDGSVDLIGNGFFDYLPGNGLYLDLDGSTGNAGKLESKTTYSFNPGDIVELKFNLAGSLIPVDAARTIYTTDSGSGPVTKAAPKRAPLPAKGIPTNS